MAMPIKDIADDNAFCLCWVTDNRIPKVAQFMERGGSSIIHLLSCGIRLNTKRACGTTTSYTRQS